jgi:integrase
MPKLTKRFVDSIKPGGKEAFYWDDDMPGFGLRQKPSGALTWVVQYRERGQGHTRRMALSRVGILTPDEARTEAKAALAAVAKGKDPSAERRQKAKDITVAALCDLWLEEGPAAAPRKKAKSWAVDASNVERHIKPLLGRKHVLALATADIERFQKDVTDGKTAADEKTGPRGRARVRGGLGAGSRATSTLQSMLSFAVSRGIRPDNPAHGVKLNKLEKRERFLSPAEFAKLGTVLSAAEERGVSGKMIDAIRLLILTGARKNEVCGLKWDWIDFERAVIRLPDSKTGAKTIPLGAPALEILSGIKRDDESPYVFPAARGDGHLTGLRKVWTELAAEAGLQGVRLHDLRHGFASVAAADGQSLFLLGKVLGHAQSRTTERYSHVNVDPVRAVADRTAKKIAAAMKGESAKVVRLTAKRQRKAV